MIIIVCLFCVINILYTMHNLNIICTIIQLESTRRLLAFNGLAASTRTSYNQYMRYWFDFCDAHLYDYSELNNTTAADFVAWCFDHTGLNGQTVSKALTSVTSILSEEGVEWKRKNCPYIGRLIKGFKKLKPPQHRVKRPLSNIHVALIWRHCIDKQALHRVALGLAILVGYFAGLRPEQVSRTKANRNIKMRQLTFCPSFDDCREISVNIRFSKTNQLGDRIETMELECYCDKKLLGISMPCPVHHLIKYLKRRINKFGKLKGNDPVFITEKGESLPYKHLNCFMYNCIGELNEIYKVNMDPTHYTPHTLRVGGCTDKARLNWPGWRIERWGRWSSDLWKRTYINLKFNDIAALLGVTVSELKANMNAKPYSD